VSNVVQLRASEALLNKQQLARYLGRSTRWVELRVRDGMPSEPPTKRFPHRRFRVADVEAWLRGGGRPPLPAHSDRLAVLESEVASLRALVEQLQRRTG
jgi:hypothetical protein